MDSLNRRTVLQTGAVAAAGLVLTANADAQQAHSLLSEKGDPQLDFSKFMPAGSCRLLARNVAGTEAQAATFPGIVADTWFLGVAGKKPWITMKIALVPLVYVRKPEYWGIEVVTCQHGLGLPMVGMYAESISIDHCRGTKGIEVIWSDSRLKIDVP